MERDCNTCRHKNNGEHKDDWACSHCDFNVLWEPIDQGGKNESTRAEQD
jgi:DNA-directed RNA polymerase subunit RPC12/RpoP